jgi:hypothetical protein
MEATGAARAMPTWQPAAINTCNPIPHFVDFGLLGSTYTGITVSSHTVARNRRHGLRRRDGIENSPLST